jgi:hypothetical protein
VREGAILTEEPLDRIRSTQAGVLVTGLGVIVGTFAIVTTPGNGFVSALLSVLGLILILFGCALFPSRTLGALVSCGLGFAALVYGLFVPGLGTTSVLLWMGVGVLLVFFGVAGNDPPHPESGCVHSPRAVVDLRAALALRLSRFRTGPSLRRVGAGVRKRVLLSRRCASEPADLRSSSIKAARRSVAGSRTAAELPASSLTIDDASAGERPCNPQRTASTAAVPMIGLALVTPPPRWRPGSSRPSKGR